VDTAGKISGEKADPRAPSSVKWFKLNAALDEFSSAMAYPCTWDKQNARWQAITDSTKRRSVHSTITGVTGRANDFVPCWWNNRGRLWEVIRPAAAWLIVQADASIAKGATGTCSVYVAEVDSGMNITAKALGAAVTAGKWCTASNDPSGTWYVFPWEC
jgi:hypothetical protein